MPLTGANRLETFAEEKLSPVFPISDERMLVRAPTGFRNAETFLSHTQDSNFGACHTEGSHRGAVPGTRGSSNAVDCRRAGFCAAIRSAPASRQTCRGRCSASPTSAYPRRARAIVRPLLFRAAQTFGRSGNIASSGAGAAESLPRLRAGAARTIPRVGYPAAATFRYFGVRIADYLLCGVGFGRRSVNGPQIFAW